MKPQNTNKQNQGEGDVESALKYNQAASAHAKSGAVEKEARDAARAVARDPKGHAQAEKLGKARLAEEDPAVTKPAWWVDEHDSAWERVKSAVKRDWEQTLADLSGGKAGEDLDQGASDTLRQMFGGDVTPPRGEPTGVPGEISWETAERATQLGYHAAGHYTGEWSPEIDGSLERDWRAMGNNDWKTFRPHAYMGWLARTPGA